MNVFYLDPDPKRCADQHIWHKHVVKMILEYAQLLSTAHHELGGEGPYKKTHTNHPSAVWVRQSSSHYAYVHRLMMNLGLIYQTKQGKVHKTIQEHGMTLATLPPEIEDNGWTDPPQCMPKEFQCSDTQKAYLNYYEHKKEILL